MSRLLAISAAFGVAGATAATAVGQQRIGDPLPPVQGGGVLDGTLVSASQFPSLRDLTQSATRADLGFTVVGDTFNGGLFLGSSEGLFFGDSSPNTCAVGSACDGGTLSSTDGHALGLAGAIIPIDPTQDIYRIVASTFTLNGADMISNTASIGGAAVSDAQFSVGASGAAFGVFPDSISPTFQGMTFDVLSASFALLHNGDNPFFPAGTATTGVMSVTTGDTSAVDSTAALAGAHILPTNVRGFGISEFQLVWEVQISPTPGATALFGLAGLAAVRRRRS